MLSPSQIAAARRIFRFRVLGGVSRPVPTLIFLRWSSVDGSHTNGIDVSGGARLENLLEK